MLKWVNRGLLLLSVLAVGALIGNQVYLQRFDREISEAVQWLGQCQRNDISEEEMRSWQQDLKNVKLELSGCLWRVDWTHNQKAVMIARLNTLTHLSLRDNRLSKTEYEDWKIILSEFYKVKWST